MKKYLKNYLNKEPKFDKSVILGILCLVIVVSGIFGWIYEVIFYYFNSGMKNLYWRGGNFLPWINIYAIGAILIIILTFKKRKNPLYVFTVSVITTGILEYIGGWILDNLMNVRCWDYTQEILSFGNINGYVCIRSVLIFGIFSLILMYAVLPICFSIAKKMKKKHFLILSYSLCAIFLIDEIYNLVFTKIFSLPKASSIYQKLGLPYLYFK